MGIAETLIGGGLVGGTLLSGRSQAKAARQAAIAQENAADASTALQREMFQQSREDMMPWLQAGSGALPELMRLAGMEQYAIPGKRNELYDQRAALEAELAGLGNGFGTAVRRAAISAQLAKIGQQQEMTPDTYGYRRSSDPNAMLSALALDPGYRFRQAEGMRGLENSAAARGGLMSGNFIRNAQRYGQDLASQEYGNAFNRLAGIAGVGQTQAQQLAGLGSQYAGNVGQNMMNAANARASGYVGKANAQAGTIGNLTNLAMLGYGMGAFGGGK